MTASAEPFWFPADLDPARRAVLLVETDEATLAAQPFLDRRWDRRALQERWAPLEALSPLASPDGGAPNLGFIFHTSFCCSTLIAAALDRRGRSLALREPWVLVQLADALRAGLCEPGQPLEIAPGLALRALARTPSGGKVIIKPSNFANRLAREAAARTSGQALFLYSDLPSFLLSIAKGGVQLARYARSLFGAVAGDLGERMPFTGRDLLEMSDLEIAALVWRMQMADLRRASSLYGPARAAWLDCEAFLADPQGAIAALDTFFDLGLGPDHVEAVTQGPLLGRHAKAPGLAFTPADRQAQAAAVRARLGADLERLVEWSRTAWPALEGAEAPASQLTWPGQSGH
ncbi:MAG TPA: hypothetical protein VLI41_12800 [Phenylobacterium sp.]|uniref:hypothetical protein n=1 Tax=Phenylobacterium sp. TaxID=1871053 RepID=UPI002C6B5C85|nr:hypothetical protein [Phenylobacterium sp.]HSV04073.1 hypothetical protein [Phenylobacterium sp.]